MNGIHMMCPWISSETHIIPEFMKTVSLMRYWLFSNIFLITEFLLSFNVNSAARVGHYGTFYKLKWRFWHFSLLAHLHNNYASAQLLFRLFYYDFCFSVLIFSVLFKSENTSQNKSTVNFLGQKYGLGPCQSFSIHPGLTTQAKIALMHSHKHKLCFHIICEMAQWHYYLWHFLVGERGSTVLPSFAF